MISLSSTGFNSKRLQCLNINAANKIYWSQVVIFLQNLNNLNTHF